LTLPDTPGRTRLTCLSLVRKGGTSPAGHPRPRVRATFVLAASDRKKQTPVATPREPELQEDPAIDSLEDRIAAARAAEDARQAKERPDAASEPARATQVISTMVGYPLGGIVVGFLFDNLFNTLPWITIVLMFLAFIGGCLHAMRLVKNRAN